MNGGGLRTPTLTALLEAALAAGASDVHVDAGHPPAVRVAGRLRCLDHPAPSADEMRAFAEAVTNPKQRYALEHVGHVDLAAELPDLGRFRVHLYWQSGGLAAALRVIPGAVAPLEALGLPAGIGRLLDRPGGLILVAGPAGSGKSTTLAALVERINRERACHVVTLEDPVEYVFRGDRSLIHQREIGTDALSFPAALRAAWRENADVIVLGEMDDPHTVRVALAAAESGHLVLASLLSSPSAEEVLRRIVAAFPPFQEEIGRLQLAGTLVAVLAQVLLPRAGGGQVAAAEFLVANAAVRSLIREARLVQIPTAIQTGASLGMVTLDASLRRLLAEGSISEADYARFSEEACGFTPRP